MLLMILIILIDFVQAQQVAIVLWTMQSTAIEVVQGYYLTTDEIEVLEVVSLLPMLQVANLVFDCAMLMALAQREDLDNNIFYLLEEEMTIMLEDVYRIMCFSNHGRLVYLETILSREKGEKLARYLRGLRQQQYTHKKRGCYLSVQCASPPKAPLGIA